MSQISNNLSSVKTKVIGAMPLSGTAKFIIQTMMLHGVKDSRALAELTGEKLRTVQAAKAACDNIVCDAIVQRLSVGGRS